MRSTKKNMLITGISGLLGNNLAFYFKDRYRIMGLYNSHPVTIKGIYTEKCELSYPDDIKRIISEYNPQVIIHCASLTNIDECEVDKDTTKRINVLATENIVEDVIDKDIKLIYISTDAVYDGIEGNFSEDDDISPNNYYGRSKYQGELEVLKKKDSLILRTNIFGWNIQEKKSLGEWILNELKSGRKIQGFKDAYFSTLYTLELARVIDMVIRSQLSGIYNCGGANSCSKYDFSMKIADRFSLDKTLITPISIDDFPFRAKRGKNLSLNVGKLQNALDYKLPTIDQSVDEFYRDYKCGLQDEIKQNQLKSQQERFLISYGRHWIDENDIQAVAEVLRSDRITQGPKVEEFERELSDYCCAKYAVALSSGTAALHVACLAAGIGPGDEVITSPNTFVASANCAAYCGARPVFADINIDTYNISPEEIEKKITKHTKAIIPVHFAGQSCDMEAIQQIVKAAEKKYGRKIYVIEDACHALGSEYRNKKVGCSEYSDMSVFSFHPVKHITTGEGGMVVTNDEQLGGKIRMLRSHGITSDCNVIGSLSGPWYYEQRLLGFNYRITDIQCALGISQFKKLSRFKQRRRNIVEHYNDAFLDLKYVTIPFEKKECNSNFHLYVLLVNFNALGMTRSEFMSLLKDKDICTQVHYIPVHTQPFFKDRFNTKPGDCPVAEQYYEECISLPLYPAMDDHQIKKVINTVKQIVI